MIHVAKRVTPIGIAFVIAMVLVVSMAGTAAAQTRYTVKPGENLYTIAARYGISVNCLANFNGITNTSFVNSGRELLIPDEAECDSLNTPPPSYTPSMPSNNVSMPYPYPYNPPTAPVVYYGGQFPANGPVPGPFGAGSGPVYAYNPVVAAPNAYLGGPDCSYTVRPGDTLYSIATFFGTSTEILAGVNHLTNPNYIYFDQVLRIPSCN